MIFGFQLFGNKASRQDDTVLLISYTAIRAPAKRALEELGHRRPSEGAAVKRSAPSASDSATQLNGGSRERSAAKRLGLPAPLHRRFCYSLSRTCIRFKDKINFP
jgi:hypothetical protein